MAKKKDPMSFREPYQGIIKNYYNNIDIASRRWVETGDPGYSWQYHRLIKELCDLKEWIKKEEKKLTESGDL